jgi:hypothetical protein
VLTFCAKLPPELSASCTDEVGAPWRRTPLILWECLHAPFCELGLGEVGAVTHTWEVPAHSAVPRGRA